MWVRTLIDFLGGIERSVGMRVILVGLLLGLISGCGRTPPNFVERPPLKGHSREVTSIAFAPDGKSLASRDAREIKLWNVESGKQTADFAWIQSDFGSVIYSPDGSKIASEGGDSAAVWTIGEEDKKATPHTLTLGQKSHSSKINRVSSLAYSPDGKFLVMGCSHGEDNGSLELRDLSKPAPSSPNLGEFPALKRPITTVVFSPDGRTIASGSMDGKIVLWDRETRKERLSIKAIRSYLAPVIFSPDGRFVASANEERWVTFWDVTTGRNAGSFKGHIKAILSLAFHPDGQTLISGDSGGTLFVWDVPSQKMMTRLESGDRGKVWSLTFSPDGKILAAGSEDRLVHLWDVIEAPATRN
jgi:WD40 repeat protein